MTEYRERKSQKEIQMTEKETLKQQNKMKAWKIKKTHTYKLDQKQRKI